MEKEENSVEKTISGETRLNPGADVHYKKVRFTASGHFRSLDGAGGKGGDGGLNGDGETRAGRGKNGARGNDGAPGKTPGDIVMEIIRNREI